MNGVNDALKITLIDAVAFLDGERIAYSLIGGLASSIRGQPRVTVDVDIVIATDVDDALNLISKLTQTQFMPPFDDVAEVVKRSFILPLRHRVTGVKVDLAIGLSGFERQLISRSENVSFVGARVQVATAEDLLIMKTLAGRPQDDQDIAGLLVAQRDHLDWDYCEQTAKELGEALAQDLLTRIRMLRAGQES